MKPTNKTFTFYLLCLQNSLLATQKNLDKVKEWSWTWLNIKNVNTDSKHETGSVDFNFLPKPPFFLDFNQVL